MKKVSKTQNMFLDVYIIVATLTLIFVMFICNYTLIDNYTFKPFQQSKVIKEICGVETGIEDIKISYLKDDNLIVFSDDDKLSIVKTLSLLTIKPSKTADNSKLNKEGVLIIDNLKKRKHIKIGFDNKSLKLQGREYSISSNLYFQDINKIIMENS